MVDTAKAWQQQDLQSERQSTSGMFLYSSNATKAARECQLQFKTVTAEKGLRGTAVRRI